MLSESSVAQGGERSKAASTEGGQPKDRANKVHAGTSYARLVKDIKHVGLTHGELANLTGVKERQVQHWAAGTSKPVGTSRDRLVDIYYVVQQLEEVYRPEGVEIWLHAKNRMLDGRRPIDLLMEGEFEPIFDAVERLASGVA